MKRYLACEIHNVQPIKIGNIDKSKPGEVETLDYISGSAIRGMVISKLKKHMSDEDKKKKILLQTWFHNGYPMAEIKENDTWVKKELIPSPKGFYENKLQNGDLKNVLLNDDFEESNKRASLGRYCYFKEDTIFYTGTVKKDNLGICVKDKKIFRENALEEGQYFKSYIAVEEEEGEIYQLIKKTLKEGTFFIGGGRSSGYGRCEVTVKEVESPFTQTLFLKEDSKEVYLYLLSNTAMRDSFGEICGINEEKLAGLLGVTEIEVERCATSICKMSGINRTWGCRTPEITMYEAGSVFKLKAKEKISLEKMRQLQENGLGVKKEEGCGRVLFLESYEKICKKQIIEGKKENLKEISCLKEEDINKVMLVAAKEIGKIRIKRAMEKYISDHENEFDQQIPKSQRGIMLTFAKNAKYNSKNARKQLEAYIKHEEEKIEKNKKQSNSDQGKEKAIGYLKEMTTNNVLQKLGIEREMLNICGISIKRLFSDDDLLLYQFVLLEKMILFMNRRGKNNEGTIF